MANLNKVMLIGRLTRDPEVRTIPNGSKVVAFGFAVNNFRKNPQTGQSDKEAVFLDCEAWNGREGGRPLADLIEQYLKKGDQAYIEGHLRLDQWKDKNDGSNRSRLKLVVDKVEFLEPRQDGMNNEGGSRPARTSAPAPAARRGPPAAPASNGNYDEPEPDVMNEPPASGENGDIPF